MAGLLAIGASVASSADTRPDWYYSDTVDFAFVKEHATVPMRTDVLIVDSRPACKFDQGLISPAINIPWREFEEILASAPQSIHLIDVRDPEEFAAGALPSARNMTVDQVEEGVSELPADKPIVFVCATGARSGEAYDIVKLARADIEVHFLDATVTYANGSYTLAAN